MEALLVLLAIAVVGSLVASPILAIVAMQAVRRLRERVDQLNEELARTRAALARFSDRPPSPGGAPIPEARPPEPAAPAAAPKAEIPPVPEPHAAATEPVYEFEEHQLAAYDRSRLEVLDELLRRDEAGMADADRQALRANLADVAARIREKIGVAPAGTDDARGFLTAYARALRLHLAATPATPQPAEGAPAPAGPGIEETLTSRWMVWLGAATVGLSAVFLFNYAVDQGWLVPAARVGLGLLLGASLVIAGEWVHRRPVAALRGTDYVPAALTSSGLFALFVSVYAAHALFGLIGAPVAFAALGVVAFAALLLALRQGWFVALLGLVGGFAIPALLESDTANALPVFLFLFVLSAGCLWLMVYRRWWWLSYATLIGALGWPVLWLAGPWTVGDQGVLGTYTAGLAALFAVFSVNLPVKRPDTPATAWLAAMLADTSGLGFVLTGVAMLLLAAAASFNEAAFVFLGVYAGIGLLFGVRRAAYESLAVAGAAIVALTFLAWPPPTQIVIPPEIRDLGIDSDVTSFGPYLMPAEFKAFARALLGFGVLFGLGGFLALRRGATPVVWSAISSAMPLFLLVMGYWRIAAWEVDVRWSTLAISLAVAFLAAAALVPRMLSGRPYSVPLGFFAAGCTGAVALAFTCVLREAWLTVALSAEVVALAWIWSRLRVAELRLIAFLAVGAVLVRLVLNWRIIDYEGTIAGLFSWVTYGYGLPALALFAASRVFGGRQSDPLVVLCQAGSAALAFLMVALQLRVWTSGAIAQPRYDLLDQSVQSVWWLIVAGILLRREAADRAAWARFGGYGLLIAASLQIGVGQVIANNPLLADEPVGGTPVLNLLLLAYGVPAVLLWLLGTDRGFLLPVPVGRALRAAASVLVFVFVSLQTRHLYWGSEMRLTPDTSPTGAEIYSYSAVWIVYALALLALGIVQRATFWRYSSLAVLIVTVLKVFLYDMSDLTGLYRVASFLGLGLTLIAIGHVYRRFVFRD